MTRTQNEAALSVAQDSAHLSNHKAQNKTTISTQ